jgi:hypothetical protein
MVTNISAVRGLRLSNKNRPLPVHRRGLSYHNKLENMLQENIKQISGD